MYMWDAIDGHNAGEAQTRSRSDDARQMSQPQRENPRFFPVVLSFPLHCGDSTESSATQPARTKIAPS